MHSFIFNALAPSLPPIELLSYSLTSTTINLNWNPVPDSSVNGELTGYAIYFQNDTTSTSKGNRTNTDLLSLTLERLAISTMYLIHVCAYNSAGDGPCARSSVRTLSSSEFLYYI